jgi:hypothetical protein
MIFRLFFLLLWLVLAFELDSSLQSRDFTSAGDVNTDGMIGIIFSSVIGLLILVWAIWPMIAKLRISKK